jgi:DivIVA domain-containing protein
VAGGDHPEPSQADGASVSSVEDGEPTERRSVSTEISDVSFATSVRGYDRGAVDAYVSRVQHLVAELEMTRSPEAAIKHALAQVGEQTKGILEQAGETAEHITVAARQEADENTGRARGEAKDLVAKAKAEAAEILGHSNAEAEATVAKARKEAAEHLQRTRDEIAALRKEAEARRQELHADTEAIRQERNQLLNDIREVATRVEEVASAADARFPPPEGSEQDRRGQPQSGAEAEPEASEVTATDNPTAEAGSRRRSPG